jgi:hypothetical protein
MSLGKEFEPVQAAFLQSSDTINAIDANETFNFVVSQIDNGNYESLEELREDTMANRRSLLTIGARNKLDPDQQVVTESEFIALASLEKTRQADVDFASFGTQVIQGQIGDEAELKARFAAMEVSSRIVMLPTGPLLKSGNFVREKRTLNEGQQAVIEDVFDTCAVRNKTVAQLSELQELLLAVDTLSPTDAKLLLASPDFSALQSKLSPANNAKISTRSSLGENQMPIIVRELEARAQLSEAIARSSNYVTALQMVLGRDITTPQQLEATNTQFVGQLTQSQLDKLNELTQAVSKLDAQTQSDLASLSKTDQFSQIIERLRGEARIALTQGEREQLDARAEIISSIRSEQNRSVAFVNILKQIESARNADEINAVLSTVNDFEEDSPDDSTLTASLKESIIIRKTSIETREALAIANRPAGVGSAIEYVFSLDKPQDDRYSQILNILYTNELANFKIGGYQIIFDQNTDAQQVMDYISTTPSRREITDLDYTAEIFTIEQELEAISDQLTKNKIVIGILDQFQRGTPATVIDEIKTKLGDVGEELLAASVFDRYRSYIAARRSTKRAEYEFLFSDFVEKARQNLLETYDFNEGLSDNKVAARYLASQYRKVFLPILQAFRNDADTQDTKQYTSSGAPTDLIRRENYRISTDELSKQRPLTDIEYGYLKSVELLSFFNPELTAVANVDPDALSVYLKNHFNKLDAQTFSSLSDGDYVPLIQIGMGAEGLISAGEIVRKNPELASKALYIDANGVGGPFAVPNGPAFGLNSANRFGFAYTLPPVDPAIERQTVRAFGSPLRWYPGERNPQQDVRQGSINMSVDYLPAVDDISDGRYANNADEALALQIQAAMVAKNLLIGTRVVDQYFTDESGQGDKIVVLERTNPDGTTQQLKLRTDYFISATGLGEPNYGIPQDTSQKLLQDNQRLVSDGNFPIFDAPLNIFKALVDKDVAKKAQPGKVFAIYGGGNTADTFVENLSRIFSTGNKLVRNIEKIYIITDSDLSRRPRYAAALDLLARNGRSNLLEIVPGRVDNIQLKSDQANNDQQLQLFQNRRVIRDSKGQPIIANTVVPATGFRSELPNLLAKTSGLSRSNSNVLKERTLPTDDKIAVADSLSNDPKQLIVGVASRTGFQGKGTAKFTQLQIDAREALLRNGAENAVAIGFRGPDTQAAVRLFLEEQVGTLATGESGVLSPQLTVTSIHINQRKKPVSKNIAIAEQPVAPIRQGTKGNSALLTALMLYELGIIKAQSGSKSFTGSIAFTLTPNDDTSYTLKSDTKITEEWSQTLLNNPFFRAYAQDSIARRRGATSISATIEFNNGRINPEQTYVQAT